MSSKNYTIPEALVDPKRIFGTPELVLSEPRLDREAKLRILRNWEQDAEALLRAENEGMEGDGPALLQRVRRAIASLTEK
jgi:hypothetical protein